MIQINEEEIRNIVKEEVDRSVRKRIKEMQGDYTSKVYLEELIRNTLWDTICDKIPTIEEYVGTEIHRVIEYKKANGEKLSKRVLIDLILDEILDN
jgi:hypothetical protein